MAIEPNSLHVWALTPNGLTLARKMQVHWDKVTVRFSQGLIAAEPQSAVPFDHFADSVRECFHDSAGHIFIMAAGIVVRTVASLLRHKSSDPAVVVVDERGRFAVSLVSGHIGGANDLARRTADLLGATAVITTATDVNGRPAVDAIAAAKGLGIENPAAIKGINMALLAGDPFPVFDPQGWVPEMCEQGGYADTVPALIDSGCPGLYVDDRIMPLPPHVLVLRPRSLVAGIGCNRGTPKDEIMGLLKQVFAANRLSLQSLGGVATIDVKQNEPGLAALAGQLGLPLTVFSRDELNQVRHVPHPSPMALKHVGVESVCEAAAILAAPRGRLIVPKHKNANATVAVARLVSLSSESVPAARTTSPSGPGRC